MSPHGRNLIGDKVSTGTGNTFRAVSPLDSTPLEPRFYQAAQADVDAAMELAVVAFDTYRRATPKARAALLERIADEIMALGDVLIERCHRETGLPPDRLVAERTRTVGQLKMFAQLVCEGSWVDARIDTAVRDRKPAPKPDLRRMLMPLGPVVVFGSSNFPLAFSVAGGDTASALAAGCPVVVKAHDAHPGTSELVATAISRAVLTCGMPSGVFSLLHGAGAEIGVALVKHPRTRAIGFTGSRSAGRALFDAAAARPDPIPVFAEMSSLNPVFLLPGALRERGMQIAEGLKQSFASGVGQFCTKPGLVFGVDSAEFAAFQLALTDLVTVIAPATMLHSGICKSFHVKLAQARASAGVSLLAQSAQPIDEQKTHGEAVVLRTDLRNFLTQPQLAEEVFGPFTLLVTARSITELREAAQHLEGQLAISIQATETDLREAAALISLLEEKAGRLIFNGFPTGVEVCPSMQHGGPYPATTDVRFTSVGTAAIFRFTRPICYQDFPQIALPDELKDDNPRHVLRLVDGKLEQPPSERF
jgi:NADP-dependent aldehyde dehydrogenase